MVLLACSLGASCAAGSGHGSLLCCSLVSFKDDRNNRSSNAALPRLQEVQEEELQRQRELVQQARAQLKEEAAVKATPPARQQPSMAIRCGARGITSRQGANG